MRTRGLVLSKKHGCTLLCYCDTIIAYTLRLCPASVNFQNVVIADYFDPVTLVKRPQQPWLEAHSNNTENCHDESLLQRECAARRVQDTQHYNTSLRTQKSALIHILGGSRKMRDTTRRHNWGEKGNGLRICNATQSPQNGIPKMENMKLPPLKREPCSLPAPPRGIEPRPPAFHNLDRQEFQPLNYGDIGLLGVANSLFLQNIYFFANTAPETEMKK
eukprot:1149476-Pelagomonas_calceolata.AAC.2